MMIFKLPVVLVLALVALFLNGACKTSADDDDEPAGAVDPFEQNKLLGRGINMGNALEAPNEGEWGVTLKSEYFQVIKQAGFNSVRIPCRWSAHAAVDSPYTIDPYFMNRVDWAIGKARSNGLAVVLNIHHYEEIYEQPAQHKKRWLGIWKQLAAHYKNYSSGLFFELLNEPNTNLTAALWNQYLAEGIALVRETNPYRTIVIGTAEWGGISALSKLMIPADEDNVIVTIHYYNPFQFTHQGAEWVNGSGAWLGTTWTATAQQYQTLTTEFNQIKTYATANNRPVFIGEFGAYNKAEMNSRVIWTTNVARESEKRGFSWAYWEFCSGFGVYDQSANTWRESLLKALIP
jgi:endoglucanase